MICNTCYQDTTIHSERRQYCPTCTPLFGPHIRNKLDPETTTKTVRYGAEEIWRATTSRPISVAVHPIESEAIRLAEEMWAKQLEVAKALKDGDMIRMPESARTSSLQEQPSPIPEAYQAMYQLYRNSTSVAQAKQLFRLHRRGELFPVPGIFFRVRGSERVEMITSVANAPHYILCRDSKGNSREMGFDQLRSQVEVVTGYAALGCRGWGWLHDAIPQGVLRSTGNFFMAFHIGHIMWMQKMGWSVAAYHDVRADVEAYYDTNQELNFDPVWKAVEQAPVIPPRQLPRDQAAARVIDPSYLIPDTARTPEQREEMQKHTAGLKALVSWKEKEDLEADVHRRLAQGVALSTASKDEVAKTRLRQIMTNPSATGCFFRFGGGKVVRVRTWDNRSVLLNGRGAAMETIVRNDSEPVLQVGGPVSGVPRPDVTMLLARVWGRELKGYNAFCSYLGSPHGMADNFQTLFYTLLIAAEYDLTPNKAAHLVHDVIDELDVPAYCAEGTEWIPVPERK